jgi:hypothetical protein
MNHQASSVAEATTSNGTAPSASTTPSSSFQPYPRTTSAAPPLYLLVIIFAPVILAIYIAATRFTDYKHHGFDILFGSTEGAICAWFAFRFYHLPIRGGAGWSWGPRSEGRAWGIGVGTGSYTTGEKSRIGRSKLGNRNTQSTNGGALARTTGGEIRDTSDVDEKEKGTNEEHAQRMV